ncbi:transporter substrate-binding domain-containing protein [Membranihabitans maritimus]|uniref:transporter substrate-binding domain-containing protein n=1 Tax=Membranihabitans maritimus TaxID=2904244 RepID=UPI001F3B7A25|nr:transporter substrate-binding domain-containing protein [Membranihabitans maritimus]
MLNLSKSYPTLLVLLALTACNFPKDPHSAFENARKNGLKIGVVHNPPYTKVENTTFSGSEILYLREFCKKERLQYHFEFGNETYLIKKLKEYKLDIVAGGFQESSIWKKEAGISKPYDKKHVFLIPKGENQLLYYLENFIANNKLNEKK